jgi:hypothetical protein
MITNPACASGWADGSTRFTHWVTLPRGSCSRKARSPSPSVSSQRAFSNMVLPGTSSTPPVITSFGSPSAWTPTTLIIRENLISFTHFAR